MWAALSTTGRGYVQKPMRALEDVQGHLRKMFLRGQGSCGEPNKPVNKGLALWEIGFQFHELNRLNNLIL